MTAAYELSMPGDAPWQILAVGEVLPAIEVMAEGPVPRGRAMQLHRVGTLLEAREVLKTARPACVLVRDSLPDGLGLALPSEWPDIPFIVIGSEERSSSAREALESGAQDYLDAGEIAPEILVRAIRYAIERKVHERGLRELEHQDRLSSLGRLAASVAHDINNPAAFIVANLSVLAAQVASWEALIAALHARREHSVIAELLGSLDLPSPGEAASLLQESRVGVERVVAIVRQLSSFARGPSAEEPFESTSLNDVIEWACLLTRNQIQHYGRLELDLAPELPSIMARQGRLGQLVTNLLVNAAHALPLREADDHVVRVSTAVVEGGVQLVVEDTGPGFEAAVLRRAFEPFFTTKGSEGTGLGLAIANEIVAAHDGSMDLGNRTDSSGARVVVHLPLTNDHAIEQESVRPPPEVASVDRTYRILVIDDERAIRRAYGRMLRPHEIVGEDGAGALERLRGGDHAFDLVLCDLMMPGVDGIAIHGALGDIAPALLERLVFSTGGVFKERVQEFLERTPVPVLTKPTSRDDILAVIADRGARTGR